MFWLAKKPIWEENFNRTEMNNMQQREIYFLTVILLHDELIFNDTPIYTKHSIIKA